jgi:hypothetical protein
MHGETANVVDPEVITQKRADRREQAKIDSFILRYNVYWTYGVLLKNHLRPVYNNNVSSLDRYRVKVSSV